MRLFRISRNCKLRSRTMVNHMQVPAQQGKDFLEGKRKMGGITVSKEPKTFHWLSPCWKEEEPFYLLGFATVAEMRAPPTGLQVVLIFTWGFCINFFTGPWARHWGSLHMKGAEMSPSMLHTRKTSSKHLPNWPTNSTVLLFQPNIVFQSLKIWLMAECWLVPHVFPDTCENWLAQSGVTCFLSSSEPAHACLHDDLRFQKQQEGTNLSVKTSSLCLHHVCYCSIALSNSVDQTWASVFVDSVKALIPAGINKVEAATTTNCHIFQAIFPLFFLPT